jgi:DNA-binding transcriptional LysR family regulator
MASITNNDSEGDAKMESGDLKIFQAVAREGSVTKAAQKMNYVQSNVTARIQHLESQLGVPLFRRSNRGMELTPAGENLLSYADKILTLMGEAAQTTQYSDQPSGPLRLGSIETTAVMHLTSLLGEYRRQYRDVQLSLQTGGSHVLVQKVLKDELDGAFVYGEADTHELEHINVAQDEMVLISAPGRSGMRELLAQPMLFFDVGCTHRERAEAFLRETGITDYQMMEFGTLAVILDGVSAGLGVSLLPRSSVANMEEGGRILLHVLPEEYRTLEVRFVYRKNVRHSSALLKFVEFIEQNK